MSAYYNEIDPYAAQWLRNLISAGHIAPGDVDERSIEDVKPGEIAHYTQCHFFAGIGLWSLALRRSGWPDERPVWTGSCPCQPFSAAGKGAGVDDERHLWPAWRHLIAERRPGVIFGEQVASKAGLGWLDLVQTDLERAGYASGAVDLCAAGFGSPNIRQRLWLVAEMVGNPDNTRPQRLGRHGDGGDEPGRVNAEQDGPVGASGCVGRLEYAELQHQQSARQQPQGAGDSTGPSEASRVAYPSNNGRDQAWGSATEAGSDGFIGNGGVLSGDSDPGPTNALWSDADWLFCRDGKWRPVEPGTFPLANGYPQRVGRLRAYGNGINVEAAAGFIKGAVIS